jgi:hypothetical protein
MQFPLRGIASEQLLEQALGQIPDGQPYAFISLEGSVYPSFVAYWGNGRSRDEFRREFEEVLGEPVGIGQDPFDIYDTKWIYLHADEVLQLEVRKNQNSYERYTKDPESYKSVIELWQK